MQNDWPSHPRLHQSHPKAPPKPAQSQLYAGHQPDTNQLTRRRAGRLELLTRAGRPEIQGGEDRLAARLLPGRGFAKLQDVLSHAALVRGKAVFGGFLQGRLARPIVMLDAIAGNDRARPVASMLTVDEDGPGQGFNEGQELCHLGV